MAAMGIPTRWHARTRKFACHMRLVDDCRRRKTRISDQGKRTCSLAGCVRHIRTPTYDVDVLSLSAWLSNACVKFALYSATNDSKPANRFPSYWDVDRYYKSRKSLLAMATVKVEPYDYEGFHVITSHSQISIYHK